MTSEDEQNDRLQAKLDTVAKTLGEEFDGVLILATHSQTSGAGSVSFKACSGNAFTHLGLATAYLGEQRGGDQERGRRRQREHEGLDD